MNNKIKIELESEDFWDIVTALTLYKREKRLEVTRQRLRYLIGALEDQVNIQKELESC